jgi:hypothetical protein
MARNRSEKYPPLERDMRRENPSGLLKNYKDPLGRAAR